MKLKRFLLSAGLIIVLFLGVFTITSSVYPNSGQNGDIPIGNPIN